MPHTKDMASDSLELVAAYVGHRAWREFCAMRDRLAAVDANLNAIAAAEARPEPAAEPSEFDAAILAARKHAHTWGTLTDRATINAVEALAREVRR
jgi:hypothetical protein